MKHIVWIASIEMNLTEKADASRFFKFTTLPPVQKPGTPRTVLKVNPQIIKKIGFDLMVFAIKNMQTLLQTIDSLSEVDIPNATPRSIELAAVPAAFAKQLCEWSDNETLEKMSCFISSHAAQKQVAFVEDHDSLLESIVSQFVRVPGGELSIAQTIREAIKPGFENDKAYAKDALEKCGIKVITRKDDGVKVVFFHTAIIIKTLLKNTDWKDADINDLLKRVTGAQNIQAKFYGKKVWDVAVPLESIISTNCGDDEDLEYTEDDSNVQEF